MSTFRVNTFENIVLFNHILFYLHGNCLRSKVHLHRMKGEWSAGLNMTTAKT